MILIFSALLCLMPYAIVALPASNSRFIMMMRWLLLSWIAALCLCGAPAKDCM